MQFEINIRYMHMHNKAITSNLPSQISHEYRYNYYVDQYWFKKHSFSSNSASPVVAQNDKHVVAPKCVYVLVTEVHASNFFRKLKTGRWSKEWR
jgi:hypothetical protein